MSINLTELKSTTEVVRIPVKDYILSRNSSGEIAPLTGMTAIVTGVLSLLTSEEGLFPDVPELYGGIDKFLDNNIGPVTGTKLSSYISKCNTVLNETYDEDVEVSLTKELGDNGIQYMNIEIGITMINSKDISKVSINYHKGGTLSFVR